MHVSTVLYTISALYLAWFVYVAYAVSQIESEIDASTWLYKLYMNLVPDGNLFEPKDTCEYRKWLWLVPFLVVVLCVLVAVLVAVMIIIVLCRLGSIIGHLLIGELPNLRATYAYGNEFFSATEANKKCQFTRFLVHTGNVYWGYRSMGTPPLLWMCVGSISYALCALLWNVATGEGHPAVYLGIVFTSVAVIVCILVYTNRDWWSGVEECYRKTRNEIQQRYCRKVTVIKKA